MTFDFESKIPLEVIEYYEIETECVILENKKYIKVRYQDLPHFDSDKERIREFFRFITYRIKVGKNLERISRDYIVQNLLKFPGEY